MTLKAVGNVDHTIYKRTLEIVVNHTGALVQEGGFWRFKFTTPIPGADLNGDFRTHDEAIAALAGVLYGEARTAAA